MSANLRDIVLSVRKMWQEAASPDLRALLERFQRATYCVTDMFLQELGKKLPTSTTRKVIVELEQGVTASQNDLRIAGPIIMFKWPLTISEFEEKNDADKKLFILGLLRDALTWISALQGWDGQVVKDVATSLISKGLVHQGFLMNGKKFRNPAHKMAVRLFFEFDIDRLRLIAVFVDENDAEIGRTLLHEERPTDAPLLFFSGKVKWLSNTKFVLVSRDETTSWPCQYAS